MKILLIMKRFSSNRDQILDNFGREVRLYSEIHKLGHSVTILCGDQVNKERKTTVLNGMDVEIYPFSFSGLPKFIAIAKKMSRDVDVVVGSTHPVFGIVAHLVTKGKGKMVYDIRDNYDTYDFIRTNIPFLKKGFLPRQINRHIIRSCDLAVCVSKSLADKISTKRNKPTIVIQNGVNTGYFKPLNMTESRNKLDLPLRVPIVIYSGKISKSRGADKLVEAFDIVRKKFPKAVLLLSGKVDDVDLEGKHITYMELPRRKDLVVAINAADVAVVPQPDNKVTKYTFPYKLMEYLACKVRVVATSVGDVKEVLKNHPGSLAEPGNVQDLADKIITAIEGSKKKKGISDYGKIVSEYTWEKLARKINKELVKLR
jgi:glycosyltransferase involved in cell wall biosynthesis